MNDISSFSVHIAPTLCINLPTCYLTPYLALMLLQTRSTQNYASIKYVWKYINKGTRWGYVCMIGVKFKRWGLAYVFQFNTSNVFQVVQNFSEKVVNKAGVIFIGFNWSRLDIFIKRGSINSDFTRTTEATSLIDLLQHGLLPTFPHPSGELQQLNDSCTGPYDC